MKILFLPYNIGSMQAITNQAMNKIEGIESVCLNIGKNKTSSGKSDFSVGSDMIELETPSKKKVFKYLKWLIQKYYYFFKLVLWADVVHYVWDSFLIADLDLRIIKLLKKPGVVEWVGSDIRCPAKAFPINPHLQRVFDNGYEYKRLESDERSFKIQKKFSVANLEPTLLPELSLYVHNSLFPIKHVILQRINSSSFVPSYPDPNNKRPLIVHSPTAKVAKGTNYIIPLMEELKKEYDFDFILLHNLPRNEVLEIMKGADIFLDQLIVGGYGTAALEAMCFGKPVMTYVMPQVFERGLPSECPIINTNPENLKEQLIRLLNNPQLRYELGVKGRAFAEKYHDADKLAVKLIEIYKGVISRRKHKQINSVQMLEKSF